MLCDSGEFIRNLVALDSGGSGGVVWRIRANETKLVCAVGSRNGTEETKLLVLDFDVESKWELHMLQSVQLCGIYFFICTENVVQFFLNIVSLLDYDLLAF